MIKEVALAADSGIADCAPISELAEGEASSAFDFKWVLRWKGNGIRARLCARGLKQPDKDLDPFSHQHLV